ncbi:MAG: Asd/ArgC dimerization domain-containing protein [Terriglobia bacterium]
MKTTQQGYRIAVVGASSLLGKELVNVLEEHHFPFSRLVTFSDDEDEPELPILDLRGGPIPSTFDDNVTASEIDFAFIAARSRQMPSFLDPAQTSDLARPACLVIDLSNAAPGEEAAEPPNPFPRKVLSVPFIDQLFPVGKAEEGGTSRVYVSASPATIVISSLLLRLGARFPLKSAVAHIFVPVSEIGSHGIDELQKQTVNVLSFQKIPRKVFGAQLAFNLLARPGGTGGSELLALEDRLRKQLKEYLQGRVPLPALRLFQVPVFHSLAVSLFIETGQPVAPEKVSEALHGERVQMRRRSQDSPTPVEVAGSDNILVDNVTVDADHPTGLWIWAVADNLRLAALNAVEVAVSLRHRITL